MRLTWGEKILKIERNQQIISEKLDELRNLEPINERYDQESYRLVFELTSWIVTTEEFLRKNGMKLKEHKRYWAFRHVFNSFKHNARIVSVENVEEEEICIRGNKYKVKPIKWISGETLDKSNQRNHEAYKTYLEDEPVIHTFNIITHILNQDIRSLLKKYK